MQARSIVFAGVALSAVLTGAGLAAFSQRASIERRVMVGVTNDKGAPVPDLMVQDFIVREDGIAREVLSVAVAPPPTHIALLVDDTEGRNGHLAELRRGISSFLRAVAALRPAPQVRIVTFGDRPETRTPWQSPALAESSLQRLALRSGAGSHFLTAIVETSRSIRTTVPADGSTAVLVAFVKNSTPEFSDITRDVVITALKPVRASLWTVELQDEEGPPSTADRERASVVGDVTRASGGTNVPILSMQGLDAGFERLLAALTSRYAVTYARTDSMIAPSRLSVEMRRRELKVVAPQWTSP